MNMNNVVGGWVCCHGKLFALLDLGFRFVMLSLRKFHYSDVFGDDGHII